jgi:hypothetical protein
MRRLLPLLAISITVALAACSTASPAPAAAADDLTKMVCEDEVRQELKATLGVDTRQDPQASWADPTFTCVYTYDTGTVTMTVRQFADPTATEAYFTARRDEQPQRREVQGLGQAAFAAPDGSISFRKDTKVMLVDVSGLPPTFGKPPRDRAAVALNIVSAVLQCWVENG